jgi:hypothetical protein
MTVQQVIELLVGAGAFGGGIRGIAQLQRMADNVEAAGKRLEEFGQVLVDLGTTVQGHTVTLAQHAQQLQQQQPPRP